MSIANADAVVSGDALVLSIAAASIVAKVTRDRLMGCVGAAHPGYGFERHMGYSVPEHFAALSRLGPCVHHRRRFAPVAALLGLPEAGGEVDEAAQLASLNLSYVRDLSRRERPRADVSCLAHPRGAARASGA